MSARSGGRLPARARPWRCDGGIVTRLVCVCVCGGGGGRPRPVADRPVRVPRHLLRVRRGAAAPCARDFVFFHRATVCVHVEADRDRGDEGAAHPLGRDRGPL